MIAALQAQPFPVLDLEATALRFALGATAHMSPFEGGWAVVLGVFPTSGDQIGLLVSTAGERKDALCAALHFATIRRVSFSAGVAHVKQRTNPLRGLTPALVLVAELKPCPKCGNRTVTTIAFGRITLGYVCTSCKWEKPEAP